MALRQGTSKGLLSLFSVGCLLLSISLPLRVVCLPNETPLGETKFSFISGKW